jgi:hypothetical protein
MGLFALSTLLLLHLITTIALAVPIASSNIRTIYLFKDGTPIEHV